MFAEWRGVERGWAGSQFIHQEGKQATETLCVYCPEKKEERGKALYISICYYSCLCHEIIKRKRKKILTRLTNLHLKFLLLLQYCSKVSIKYSS